MQAASFERSAALADGIIALHETEIIAFAKLARHK